MCSGIILATFYFCSRKICTRDITVLSMYNPASTRELRWASGLVTPEWTHDPFKYSPLKINKESRTQSQIIPYTSWFLSCLNSRIDKPKSRNALQRKSLCLPHSLFIANFDYLILLLHLHFVVAWLFVITVLYVNVRYITWSVN